MGGCITRAKCRGLVLGYLMHSMGSLNLASILNHLYMAYRFGAGVYGKFVSRGFLD